jgi:hypothetical protein
MTVISLNTNVTYTSTGSVGPYGFNFPIAGPAALLVIVDNTTLPSTSYTIAPVNNDYDNGGSVTLNSPPAVGVPIVLQRSTPLTQTTVFADNMPQPMQQFEEALDKLTEIAQELAANEGGEGTQTYVIAGTGITVTGTGSQANPYVISTLTPLSITSFTGGQVGEIGQTFSNPRFSATYMGTPTSANITNTDNIGSPLNLISPFTSGTILGTFSHSVAYTTTFTLTASNGINTPTATQTMTWNPRIFAGLGAAGATSIVTSSGTTAILSTTDVLPSVGLGAETVGQTFGPFSPSAAVIYLLLTGGSHTFIDAITGFPFAFNAAIPVSFVNHYGVLVTMYLYQSTNVLTGTFQPKVAS